jgi:Neutral/alkaline non-lysosomal ceramidase, N-terminal
MTWMFSPAPPNPNAIPMLHKIIQIPLWLVVFSCPLTAQDAAAAPDQTSSVMDAGAANWKSGAAKINITPDVFMWMAGYGSRSAPADGKLTDLWAKALMLEDAEGNRAVLITLDLIGIDGHLATKICKTLEEKHGLERRQIAFCTSHTHSGPVVGRQLAPLHYLQISPEQQQLVDQYAQVLEAKIVDVVGQSLQRLEPSRMTWGTGIATFAVNRRENKPYDKVALWRTAGALKGPVDHDVPVLALRDLEGGLKTILFGYACHATTLSLNQWSGDYPGFAQIDLEAAYPGCIAMFWAGCGADQNPLPRRTVDLARHYGRRLATAVESVLLTSEMMEIPSCLSVNYAEVELALEQVPTQEELLEQSKSNNRYNAALGKMLLAQIDRGETLSQSYPYPVGLWRLGQTGEKQHDKQQSPAEESTGSEPVGQVDLVFLGGEVVVDYAIRLKSELAGLQTWVAGYSNDVMAYIPSRRVLAEGGYEGTDAQVYYGLPCAWKPDLEKAIVDQVHALRKSAAAKAELALANGE